MPRGCTVTPILMPKAFMKYQCVAQTKVPNTNMVGKICCSQQITRAILKPVQDRCIVSVKGKQQVVCALSNVDIANNLEWKAVSFLVFEIWHTVNAIHCRLPALPCAGVRFICCLITFFF